VVHEKFFTATSEVLSGGIKTNIIEHGESRYYLLPDFLDWGVESALRPQRTSVPVEDRSPVYEIGDGEFDYLTICVTNKCNTICQYCFRGFDMAERPAVNLEVFSQVVDHFRANSAGSQTIQFTGGEIFVVPDFLDWLDYARRQGFRLWLNSNGIAEQIGTDTRLHELLTGEAHIRISLDGHTPQLHERFRKRGSFAKVVRNIEALCRAGVSVSVKTVLTPENFPHIEEIVDFVYSLGVSGWNYNVIRTTGAMAETPPERSSIKCDKKIGYVTYLDINRTLLDLVRRRPRLASLLAISRFGKDIDTLYSPAPRGVRMIPYFLNYDGEVYFADDLMVPRYSRGNIFSDGMAAFNGFGELADRFDTNLPGCVGCPIHRFCFQKGNYGELYAVDPDLATEFPNCWDIRNAFVHLLAQHRDGADIYEAVFS
jgi:MoaA/NifB/PqqE/SkfB family radical SAM enzyme